MRKLIIAFLCCIVVLLAGYAGYRSYKIWKQHRLMAMARGFAARGDERNAYLSLQLALRANPRNIEACRMMADIADSMHSPDALLWRNRVVELNPHSLQDRISLARTAIGSRDLATATNALGGVSPADKETAEFQNISGTIAVTENQPLLAQAYFLEAIRLQPQNAIPQLNLAVLRLYSTNAAELAEAKNSLRVISVNTTNGTLRCSAYRELVVDALRHKESAAATDYARRLLQETNSSFSDRILWLNALSETKDPDFKSALSGIQNQSRTNSTQAYEVASWQVTKTPAKEVLAWLKTLPLATQTNQPLALFETECFSMARDWRGMQDSLAKQNWGEVDFMRHAFLSRALYYQDLGGASQGEWEQAVKGASAGSVGLSMLLHFAVQFGMTSETEDILWNLVKEYPQEKWASELLAKDFMFYGRTSGLLALFREQLKTTPNDLATKNNLAMVGLLLKNQEVKPDDLAHEVYEQNPTNASYAATYAFALYLQGKNAQALKIFEQLKPEQLEQPGVAGYYGLSLAASGDHARAKKYLELSSKANLLPEEKKLFDKAKAG